jgi:DNA-binding SARP family transcriptional activator
MNRLFTAIREATWLRSILGFGPLIVSTLLFLRAMHPARQESADIEPRWDALGDFLGAGICLLVAIIAFAPVLAEWVTTPARRWVDSLFGATGGPRAIPAAEPLYKRARKCLEEERYEDALEALETLIEFHPTESTAYQEALALARATQDPEAEQRLLKQARKHVQHPEIRAALGL